MHHFLHNIKGQLIAAPVAPGSTGTGATDAVDLSGFTGVALIAVAGAHAALQSLTLRPQGATSSTVTSTAWENLSTAISTTAGADNRFLILDIHRPRFRFIRGFYTRSSTAGGSHLGGIMAFRYGAKSAPVQQDPLTRGSTGRLVLTT